MAKRLLIISVVLLQGSLASAQDLQIFLKRCAYGTLFGAGAGVVSLAFTDKPSESWNNVAKGASLGLYAGIAYGLYQLKAEPQTYNQPEFSIYPKFENGSIRGVEVAGTVLEF